MADEDNGAEVLRLAVTIVSAYVSNNSIALADVPALIVAVHEALVNPGGTPKKSKSQSHRIILSASMTARSSRC